MLASEERQLTKVFPKQTRTVNGISVVPRLRAWKQPELKLHNIPKKLSRELETYLSRELPKLSSHPLKFRFDTGDWYFYIHIDGKIRNKKKFVLLCRDFIYDWLSKHGTTA